MEHTMQLWFFFLVGISHLPTLTGSASEIEKPAPDPKGYLMFCPCMGRFGNQAEQFLGSVAFAKALDRTLVVPPWIEFRQSFRSTVMVPYEVYFKLEALGDYHRVISMEEFMKTLAPTVWPEGTRKVFCYSARHGSTKGKDCNAKDGNPFGPFWDSFNVNFDQSEIFGPLFYDTQSHRSMEEWRQKYPSSSFPVLAFVGAPAAFPIVRYHVRLQRYVQWSDDYDKRADEFIKEKILSRPFIAIHLRNGIDFERACEHVSTAPNMFAAQQCIGDRSQYGTTTHEMCFPSTDTVVKQVKKEVERLGVKTLFIATDANDMKTEFAKNLENVALIRQDSPADPLLDLAIMGRADHFIGNCVSTFTAFVKRERDIKNLTSSFWAFEFNKKKREEL